MKKLSLIAVLLAVAPSWAIPPYARFYKEKYGLMPNCSLCHQMKDWNMTGYGDGFEEGGRTLAAMTALEDKDSDGDGVKDGVEARGKSNPGDPASRPRRLGPWLDEVKIRPPNKVINKAFPGNAQIEVLFPTWTPESRAVLELLGDEALYPVLFRAKDASGKALGASVYVSHDVPGLPHGTNMIIVSATAAGEIADVKFVHHEGDRAVKQDAYLDAFKGRTLATLGTGPAVPAGAEKDAMALTTSVRKALTVLREAAK